MSTTREKLADVFTRALADAGAREGVAVPSRAEVVEQLGKRPPAREVSSAAAVVAQKHAHRRRMAELAEPATSAERKEASAKQPVEAVQWRPIRPPRATRRTMAAIARVAPKFSPRDWSDRVWAGNRAVFDTHLARKVEAAARELPIAYRMRVYAACLSEQRGRGDQREGIDFGHITTQGIVVAAIMLFREAVPTKKRGFARVLAGVSQNMIAAAFRNPQTGEAYSVGRLFATEIHGDKERAGWVRALARAQALQIIQPPPDVSAKEHVGPSGHALAQYWITERAVLGAPRCAQLAILASAGGECAAFAAAVSSAATPPRGPP